MPAAWALRMHCVARPMSRSSGFSQKTGLPAAAQRSIQSAWRIGRAGNQHGVNVGLRQRLVGGFTVRHDHCFAELGGCPRIGVAHGHQGGARAAHDVFRVDATDAPRAYQHESNHLFPLTDAASLSVRGHVFPYRTHN